MDETNGNFDSLIKKTAKNIKKADVCLAKKQLKGLIGTTESTHLNMIAYEDLSQNKI